MTGPRPTMSIFVTLKDLASDGFRKLAGTVDDGQKKFNKLGGVVGTVGKAFAVLGGAMAVGHFFKGAIAEASEAEEIQTRLRQAVENTGGSFDELSGPIEDTTKAMSRLTKYSDDDLKSALSHLTITSGDAKGSLANLGLVTDLASAKQIDLKTSAELVGKVMAGETGSLSRYGIVVEEGADAIQVMRDRFGGFAAEEGKSFSGMLARVTNGWKDFQESVGAAILSNDGLGRSAEGIVGWLAKLEGWVTANSAAISEVVGYVIEFGEQLWAAVQPIWNVGVGIVELADRLGIIKGAVIGVKVIIAGLLYGFETLAGIVQVVFAKIEQVIGGSLGLVSGVLRKFGLDVGETAAKVKAAGDQMLADGLATGARAQANLKDRLAAAVIDEQQSQDTRTRIAKKGGEDRVIAAHEEGAKLTQAQKDANSAMERASNDFEAVFGAKVPAYISAVQKALAAQNDALQRSNLLTAEQKDQLTARRAELERTLPILQRLAAIDVDEKRVDLIEDQVERVRVLQDLYDRTVAVVSALKPETEAWNTATAMQLDYGKRLKGLQGEIGKDLLEHIGIQRTMNLMLGVAASVTGDLAAMTDIWGSKAAEGADAVDRSGEELANAARGAIQLAIEFGGMDEKSGRVLTNVVNLAGTLQKGFGSLAAGDIIGAVGAVAGILGSIFGGNDENKAVVRENSKRLAELRDGIRAQVSLSAPGARVAAVESALAAFGPAFASATKDLPDFMKNSAAAVALFGTAQQSGVRVTEIEDIAKELGISIRNADGEFVGTAINQLLAVLRTADITGFGSSVQGRMDQLDAEFDVRGTVSAQEQLTRRLALLMDASPILKQTLGGLDLSTAAGLQQGLAALQQLVPHIGNVAIGQFGDLNRQDTIDWATKLADLMRQNMDAVVAPTGDTGLGDIAADFAATASVAGAEPTFSTHDLIPDLTGTGSNDLTRAADGIERLELRMTEVRDAILRGAAASSRTTGASAASVDAALDALLEFVDRGLQQQVSSQAFGKGAV